jgi:hypothetical protein
MARQVISHAFGASARRGPTARSESNSQSATLLIRRLLSYPVERERGAERSDVELVPFASALLQCRVTWDRAFGLVLAVDPVWSLLLLVYVRQANSSGVTVASLWDLPVIGPGTVLVRWIMKLIGDGILELAEECAGDAEPVVRLSPDGLHKMEHWLRSAKAEFGRLD